MCIPWNSNMQARPCYLWRNNRDWNPIQIYERKIWRMTKNRITLRNIRRRVYSILESRYTSECCAVGDETPESAVVRQNRHSGQVLKSATWSGPKCHCQWCKKILQKTCDGWYYASIGGTYKDVIFSFGIPFSRPQRKNLVNTKNIDFSWNHVQVVSTRQLAAIYLDMVGFIPLWRSLNELRHLYIQERLYETTTKETLHATSVNSPDIDEANKSLAFAGLKRKRE